MRVSFGVVHDPTNGLVGEPLQDYTVQRKAHGDTVKTLGDPLSCFLQPLPDFTASRSHILQVNAQLGVPLMVEMRWNATTLGAIIAVFSFSICPVVGQLDQLPSCAVRIR